MLSYKPGVKLFGLKTEILAAIAVAESVYTHYGVPCVVTSVTEGEHSPGSRHYIGQAIDIRTRNVPNEAMLSKIVVSIKDALTDEYDVVLETTHLHIEVDPKA